MGIHSQESPGVFLCVCKCVNVQLLFSPSCVEEDSGQEDVHFIALN